jgi:hypothetical protein
MTLSYLVGGTGVSHFTHFFVPHDFVPYPFVPYSVMNYPYNIPSVTQTHPALGDDPNIQVLQSLHTANLAGTPIDPAAVIEAEDAVKYLSGAKSECSLLHVHN